MVQRNIITGKDVFYNTLEKVFYIRAGKRTHIASSIEEVAYCAWTIASQAYRAEYLADHFSKLHDRDYSNTEYQDLPQYIKDAILEYQKSKTGKIPV